MNTVTEIAPVITAANEALRRDFPLKPFAIRHKLAGHPLLARSRSARTRMPSLPSISIRSKW